MHSHFIEQFNIAVSNNAEKPAVYFAKNTLNYQDIDRMVNALAQEHQKKTCSLNPNPNGTKWKKFGWRITTL